MSFELRSDDVDVEQIMAAIRKRIEEKRGTLYTDEELEEIARHRLDEVLDAHEWNADFAAEFRARQSWNFQFNP
jgi:Cdc6-like AAA superfamily ATPase